MSDDNFERFIGDAAEDYNRPPARTPREEMWARIERARAAGREDVKVVPLRRGRWIGIAAAIAAALIIGILLGRSWSPETSGPAPLASNTPNTPQPPGLERRAEPDTAVIPVEAPRMVAAAPRGSRRPEGAVQPQGDVDPAAEPDRSYEVARTNHLAQMEALLTTYRAQETGRVDGQLATWARDLLTTTRLLLDSPAAEDGKNRRLLEDLELVLVQIVNLAPNAGAADRGSIERTLENGQVMTRLRSAVPAGGLPSGT